MDRKKVVLVLVAIGLICLLVISISAFDPIGRIRGLFRKEPEGPKTVENLYVEGRVGIGTTEPEYKLHIIDNDDVYLQLDSSSATDKNAQVFFKNDGRAYNVGIQGYDDIFTIYDSNAGAHRLSIDTNGKVGIGTTNPEAKVHVITSGITNAATFESSDGAVFVDLASKAVDGRRYRLQAGSGGDFQIVDITAEPDVVRLFINSDGNVGIGTENPGIGLGAPTGILEVYGSSNHLFQVDALAGGIEIVRAENDSAYIDFKNSATEDFDMRWQFRADAPERISLYSPVTNSEVFTVTKAGNVGIGTIEPDAKLHVAGNAMIDTGGSANKVVCWKTDGKTLGYCSDQPGADGSCTCN